MAAFIAQKMESSSLFFGYLMNLAQDCSKNEIRYQYLVEQVSVSETYNTDTCIDLLKFSLINQHGFFDHPYLFMCN
jgi:hypothetical protein